ncbi:hypothetical protein SADUNF_Sadunf01G0037900 [Salix dunnii]|uniref:F-box domain-containing protein n=1 Tax=Salix dunnii TaxID=1413687 RepID=A0A835NAA0_9ROSI|nr:hypothetical protein SADUNF_Sadunf01G0037900 [Salix dunnii]
MDISKVFPEECLAHIISFTSPRDACRSALVSRNFQLAADSDAVWKGFLPPIMLKSCPVRQPRHPRSWPVYPRRNFTSITVITPSSSTMVPCFALEKHGGKKCYMIGARALSVIWGDEPSYWTWKSVPDESRFSEVAELRYVWWLEVTGWIDVKILSPKTTYAAYLVFKLTDWTSGFNEKRVELSVHFEGSAGKEKLHVFLDVPPGYDMPPQPRERSDGWMEIEMGEFFSDNENDGCVRASLKEVDNYTTKNGLIIEGIEFRPKEGR